MKWVIFYAIDGLGLGHIRRLSRLCHQMMTLDNTVKPLFITNALQHTWLQQEGWPYYYLPSDMVNCVLETTDSRCFPPDGLGIHLLKQIINFVHPSVVVVDTYFTPELLSYCEADTCFIGIFDSDWCGILHTERVNSILERNGLVLIANNPDRGGPLATRFLYTGAFLLKRDKDLEEKLATRYWTQPGKLRILCTQGGGGFTPSNSVFERVQPYSFLTAIDHLVGDLGRDVETLFFTGPYQKAMAVEHLTVHPFDSDLAYLYASADIALIRGGYSQTAEAFSMSCPTVIYPRCETFDDQRQNLAIWAGYEGMHCWDDNVVDSAAYVRSLLDRRCLSQTRCVLEAAMKSDGLSQAAMCILDRVR